MEFWNDMATDKSWQALLKISKQFKFILIGGWACYLHTKTIKSKDIDLIADFDCLEEIKKNFALRKNDRLKKYETIVDDVSVDIYVPFYSKFAIDLKEMEKNSEKIEGFTVPKPEILLILKQQAEFAREKSTKGQKDRVDILNILMKSRPDMKKYKKLLEKYNLQEYSKRLKKIIITAKKEFEYLGIANPREIKLQKKKLIGLIE